MEFDYIELFIEMKHWRYCFGNSFCVEFQNTQDKMRDYLLRGDCARASGGLNPRNGWSRIFYFVPVLICSQSDQSDALVDPVRKGGC